MSQDDKTSPERKGEVLEIVRFECPCGKTVDYENPNKGAVAIGHWHVTTGWFSVGNNFDGSSIWLCPECAAAAIEQAATLATLLGTENVGISSILSLRKWEKE